ncbi:MAG: TRAP transporter small permease subunit [Salinarimonas sp.]|nr:TRAP transporter small permease subunit [Salinarimonas sp.]
MTRSAIRHALEIAARLVGRVLAPVAALLLFAIMALMVADVIGRYLFNAPIRGAYEIIEFLMCLMILSALPLVSLQGRHVEASLVADLVPRAATLLHWIAGLTAAGLLGLLAMLMWNYAGQLARQNAQSLFGAIPHAPFATFMAVLFAIAAVTALIATAIRKPGDGPAVE